MIRLFRKDVLFKINFFNELNVSISKSTQKLFVSVFPPCECEKLRPSLGQDHHRSHALRLHLHFDHARPMLD